MACSVPLDKPRVVAYITQQLRKWGFIMFIETAFAQTSSSMATTANATGGMLMAYAPLIIVFFV